MWGWIAKLLGSTVLQPVLDSGVKIYQAKLDAGNTADRIAAELAARELAVTQREAEVNSDVVRVEQGNWATRWVRPVWAAPYVILTWKVVVWDWCLGWGTTVVNEGFFTNLGITIAVSYYGGRTFEKVAAIVKRKLT
jgi:hypothetical protein